MKRDAASRPTRSRSPRKKPAEVAAAAQPAETAPDREPAHESETGDGGRNVSPTEGGFSVAAGVLILVAALFPRTLKQLLLLGIGGGLVYRGMTGKCGVYAALGIDTAKEPLLKQINEKYLSATGDA